MLTSHPLFRDHMVFQAGKPIRIFGSGTGLIRVSLLNEEREAVSSSGKWYLELPPLPYGGPYSIKIMSEDHSIILHDIMIGEVLLCAGQSNMQFTMAEEISAPSSYQSDPFLRIYTVDRPEGHMPLSSADGWVQCEAGSVEKWSALGYLVGTYLREKGIPCVGIVLCAQGASVIQSWISLRRLRNPKLQIPPEQLWKDHFDPLYQSWNTPSFLYETMLKHVMPFSFGVAVWYQGESNVSPAEGKIYTSLLSEMILDWRELDRDNRLPFIVVQIADTRQDEGWIAVQRAQTAAAQMIPFVQTVVSGDVCEKNEIHPATKGLLAKRIADTILFHAK